MDEVNVNKYREVVELHERIFQKYSIDNNVYLVPVDETEEDRLILQHRMFTSLFDDKLFLAPLEYPKRILECGYGSGVWATAMAECYDDSEITALDVYPLDLPDEPENLFVECWDLNHSLIPAFTTGSYDFIHARCITPGIKTGRWPRLLHEFKRLLMPGGWLQLAEFYYNVQSDSGRLTERHELYRWGEVYRRLMQVDRDPRVARSLEQKLRDTGFHDVRGHSLQVPIGNWPADERLKTIGIYMQQNMQTMIESLSILPFTDQLGWTAEQVKWMVQGAVGEMEQGNHLRLYLPLYVACGKRRSR